MAVIRVGVLRGGPSSEYEVSLNTGGNILKCLPAKYKGFDVLIDKTGAWHINGLPTAIAQVGRSVDVVFNALHGEFGEDGKVQHLLETHKIPYTGSGVFAASLAMNKILSRRIFENAGIKMPRAVIAKKTEPLSGIILRVLQKIGPWWVVKPASRGSSVNLRLAKKNRELAEAIVEVFEHDESVLIEEFIEGREATCAVIENFHKQEHYALPVVEIALPKGKKIFDFEAKYSPKTAEICPSRFDNHIKKEIEETARKAHVLLGCRDYSRSDFIVSRAGSRKGIYLLETNALPGLTETSLFPKAARAMGIAMPTLLHHIISSALQRSGK